MSPHRQDFPVHLVLALAQGFTDPSFALKKIEADPHEFSVVLINYSSQLKNQRKGSGKFGNEVKKINENIKTNREKR